jgi:hypothetical protein
MEATHQSSRGNNQVLQYPSHLKTIPSWRIHQAIYKKFESQILKIESLLDWPILHI